jgi:hypothetical protein
MPGDTAASHQIQKALFIELRWPTDRDLETSANRQIMIRCKEHAGTADIERLPTTGKNLSALV